jgi:hypothetical protein
MYAAFVSIKRPLAVKKAQTGTRQDTKTMGLSLSLKSLLLRFLSGMFNELCLQEMKTFRETRKVTGSL